MAKEQTLQFMVGGLFHDLVTAYQAAICGLLIYHPHMGNIEGDPVGFASTVVPPISFPAREIQERIRANAISLGFVTDRLTYMLINAAYELAQARFTETVWADLRQKHPEIEFLRHVRNAASHNGRWHFAGREPSRSASWRKKRLVREMHGVSLFGNDLKPGDILVLLWDIEQILK